MLSIEKLLAKKNNLNLFTIKEFFFVNKTIKQTVLKNTFWLGLSSGLNKTLKLILLVYAARILGTVEYGKFNFALAFIALFGIFQDCGISTIITREFAREKEKEKEFHALFALEILLSIGTFILILLSTFLIVHDYKIKWLIIILALYASISSMVAFFYSFFQARQRMEYQTLSETIQVVLVTILGIFILLKIPSAINLSYGYLFSIIIGFIFILLFFRLKIFPLKISWQTSVWRKFLLMSWPIVLAGLFDSLYNYTDSVMLGFWKMFSETGWYNAAFRITWTLFLLTGLIIASLFPVLSKAFKKSKEELQRVWNYEMELMIILATPLIIGGIVLAPRIILFLYGPKFIPAILAFQILIIMTGVLLIYNPFYQVLLVSNQQKKFFWIILSGAMLNIVLNLILIPKYTLYGAAVATLISHILVLFLLYLFTLKYTSIRIPYFKFLNVFTGTIISGTIMLFAILIPQIYYSHIILSISIGAGIYVVCLLIYRKLISQFFAYQTL